MASRCVLALALVAALAVAVAPAVAQPSPTWPEFSARFANQSAVPLVDALQTRVRSYLVAINVSRAASTTVPYFRGLASQLNFSLSLPNATNAELDVIVVAMQRPQAVSAIGAVSLTYVAPATPAPTPAPGIIGRFNELTAGEKTAVGVGATFAVVALVAVALWLRRRWRKDVAVYNAV
jgi:uncharacterized protein (TIGR03382 family)